MNKGLTKDVYLYFNTNADNDNIGASSNCCMPAKNLVSMGPVGDSTLALYFKSLRNDSSAKMDTVHLTLAAANTHLDVMNFLIRKINDTRPTFDGFIDVVDDHTVIIGGGANSRTLATGLTPGAGATSIDGVINSGGVIDLADASNSTITATADGTGTGTVPGGGFYTTDSANADHIVILPAPIAGTVVYLNSIGETGQAYELRTSAPGSISLNNVTGSGKESVIAATDVLVQAICVSTTAWVVNVYDRLGAFGNVDVAD